MPSKGLTRQQRMVARMVALGWDNEAIARYYGETNQATHGQQLVADAMVAMGETTRFGLALRFVDEILPQEPGVKPATGTLYEQWKETANGWRHALRARSVLTPIVVQTCMLRAARENVALSLTELGQRMDPPLPPGQVAKYIGRVATLLINGGGGPDFCKVPEVFMAVVCTLAPFDEPYEE